MGFLLFLVAMGALALMSSSRAERQEARRRTNKRFAWLWIPTVAIIIGLMIPR